MLGPAISITRPRTTTATRTPTSGLKAQAIARGAHQSCMAAGREGACDRCLFIVDAIIDSRHARPSGARVRANAVGSAAPITVADPKTADQASG